VDIRTTKLKSSRRPSFEFWSSFFGLLVVAGCGAPGEPTPPSPPVPTAVTDLSARQAGDGVQLTFTMPAKTVSGDRLVEPLTVEILRGTLKADGSPDAKSFRVVYTIPGSLVGNYQVASRLQFVDPIAPQETRAHPGATLAYRVRTRASKKRASADSNTVTAKVFPVPERIAAVQAKLTESAIELSWAAPTRTSADDPLSSAPEFHIYRGQLDPQAHQASAKDSSPEKWISPLLFLARSDTLAFRDTQFDFGKTYSYVVRSAITVDGNVLESDDSSSVVVDAVDTFPPAAPQGLIAAAITGAASTPPEIDLSWSLNVETDLAGYRVYRSERQDDNGRLLTPDLLLSPAYRDTSVQPGSHYWYRVTAVDHSGNESAPSASVSTEVTQPSP
jgi:hypothetical protein